MDTLFTIILYIHIAFGTLSLLIGTWIMMRKKGDKLHKQLGLIYVVCIVINGLSALLLATIRPNYFLFIVGIFSTYMAVSGYRILKIKQLPADKKVPIFDIMLTDSMAIFGFGFITFGGYMLFAGNTFGIVLITFGLISTFFVYNDFKYYKHKQKEKNYWLLSHISKMVGSYISAFTAFLVVNNTILPNIIAWLLPTLVGLIFIVKWSRQAKNR